MQTPANETTRIGVCVFNYSSYVDFLADAYTNKHERDSSFSYEFLARSCGLRSRTYVRNIIKGATAPSISQLRALAAAFDLDAEETGYLVTLFKFKETKEHAVAFELFQELMRHQSLRPNHPNHNDPFREIAVATSVLHLTLLALVEVPDFQRDSAWIASRLRIRASPAEIESALQDLESAGYMVREEISGKYRANQAYLKKMDDKPNFFLRKFHHECLALAQDAIENRPMEDRYLVGTSFAINSRSYPRIIQKLNAFLENLLRVEALNGAPDTTVQLNAQLIRTSAPISDAMLGIQSPESNTDETQEPMELSH